MTSRKKVLLLVISISLVVLLVMAAAAGLWISSGLVLKPPHRPLEERHIAYREQSAEYGIALEAMTFATADGLELKGYLVNPHPQPGAAERTRRMWQRLEKAGVSRQNQPRGTVILHHGRGGKKENMLVIAQRLVAADLRCIVYDARGQGESGGRYSTYGWREAQDLRTILDQVDSNLSHSGEQLGPVFAFGNSMGAATVLLTLAERGETRIRAGVAVAPFADYREVVRHAIGNVTEGRCPGWLRTAIVDLASWRAGLPAAELSPATAASSIQVPVMIAHGRLDEVIPIEQASRIYQNLPGDHHIWRELPEAHHYDVLRAGGDDLYEEMIHFFLAQL